MWSPTRMGSAVVKCLTSSSLNPFGVVASALVPEPMNVPFPTGRSIRSVRVLGSELVDVPRRLHWTTVPSTGEASCAEGSGRAVCTNTLFAVLRAPSVGVLRELPIIVEAALTAGAIPAIDTAPIRTAPQRR